MTTEACRGFVYATAVMGVTGARTTTSDLAGPLVARGRRAATRPARRRRARGLQRRPGRRGRVVRRRRHRRLRVRPHAARRRRTGASGLDALAALTRDLADGVRRGAVAGRPPAGAGRSAAALLLSGCASGTQRAVAEATATAARHHAQRARSRRRTVPLTDTDGAPYSLAAQTDKPLTLLFFGYTNCPDICQMVMANIASALARLDEGAAGRRRRGLRDHRPGAGRPRRCCATTSTASTTG